jgi:hypothetical protein
MATFPNTESTILRGTGDSTEGRTSAGLSTQIIIKVNNQPVGALQSLNVTQTRPLQRINEIGVDGNIEIVPLSSTTYELAATRIVFDQLRLPEAFSRSFRFIGAQRVPFDIEVFDINNADEQNAIVDASSSGIVVMKYVNCWFQNYVTPYAAENYLITETASIWAETGFVSSGGSPPPNLRSLAAQTDATSGIESAVNTGDRRGGVDAAGIINAVFQE